MLKQHQLGDLHRKICAGIPSHSQARSILIRPLFEPELEYKTRRDEEDFADNAVWTMNLLPRDKHVMPWRIEDEMNRIGANYIQAGLWRGFAIRDGNLITGQQNFSGGETVELLVQTLGA